MNAAPVASAIIEAVAAGDGGQRAQDEVMRVCCARGIAPHTIRQTMSRMTQRGRLRRMGRNRPYVYALPDAPPPAPASSEPLRRRVEQYLHAADALLDLAAIASAFAHEGFTRACVRRAVEALVEQGRAARSGTPRCFLYGPGTTRIGMTAIAAGCARAESGTPPPTPAACPARMPLVERPSYLIGAAALGPRPGATQ